MRFENGWVRNYRDVADGVIGQRGLITYGLWNKILAYASRFEVKGIRQKVALVYPPGTVVTSLRELAGSDNPKDLSKVRRDLEWLEEIGKITQEATLEGRVISVLEWDSKYVDYCEKTPNFQHSNEIAHDSPAEINENPHATPNAENPSRKLPEILQAAGTQLSSNIGRVADRQYIGDIEEERIQYTSSGTKTCAKGADQSLALFEIWNTHRGGLPEAKALTASRRRHARSRLLEKPDLEYWKNIVQTLATSSFCQGDNKNGWKATIDFLLRPDTHVKVTEGLYQNSKATSEIPRAKTIEELHGLV